MDGRLTLIRVLIADPDESLLAVYRELLRKEFDVVTAFNGLKCVARLRERMPDVLVLEPQLPWGGGAGVLAMIRDESGLVDVPVMILTACRDRQVLESVAPFPISDYYVKPLSPAHLATRIRILLGFRRARRTRNDEKRALEIAKSEKETVHL
jgi:DNA-binding response OmpR family regulator